jgi:tetratricopeptide (TPR) repeat protein
MKIKEWIQGILIVAIIASLVIFTYNYKGNKVNRDLAKRIAGLSSHGGVPEGIDGLKTAIAAYEAQIERNVQEGAQTGVYWKILGIRLSDKGMHQDAIKAFERAIYYNAEDPTLFALTGESASTAAASSVVDPNERERLLNIAESSFLRAIQLDAIYARPRLGLGLLYTFDMVDRAADAIPHLERYLDISHNNIQGMFVLARACYMTEDYPRAIDLYDRIISRTKDTKIKEQAQKNKEAIWDLM